MKITLRPQGAVDDSTDVVLSDGADRADETARGPSGASISVSIQPQANRAIRARYEAYLYRKGRAGSYSFTASRRFADLATAGIFLLTHGMWCPASGTLIFEWSDDAEQLKVVLCGCVFRQIGDMQQVGLTIKTNYAVSFSYAKEVLLADLQTTINQFYAGAYVVS